MLLTSSLITKEKLVDSCKSYLLKFAPPPPIGVWNSYSNRFLIASSGKTLFFCIALNPSTVSRQQQYLVAIDKQDFSVKWCKYLLDSIESVLTTDASSFYQMLWDESSEKLYCLGGKDYTGNKLTLDVLVYNEDGNKVGEQFISQSRYANICGGMAVNDDSVAFPLIVDETAQDRKLGFCVLDTSSLSVKKFVNSTTTIPGGGVRGISIIKDDCLLYFLYSGLGLYRYNLLNSNCRFNPLPLSDLTRDAVFIDNNQNMWINYITSRVLVNATGHAVYIFPDTITMCRTIYDPNSNSIYISHTNGLIEFSLDELSVVNAYHIPGLKVYPFVVDDDSVILNYSTTTETRLLCLYKEDLLCLNKFRLDDGKVRCHKEKHLSTFQPEVSVDTQTYTFPDTVTLHDTSYYTTSGYTITNSNDISYTALPLTYTVFG